MNFMGYVAILILVESFLQYKDLSHIEECGDVAILILVESFLQSNKELPTDILENRSQSLF